jgi:hypothetical protein
VSFDLYIIPARPGLTPDDVNASFDRIEAGEAWPFGEPTDALRACLADIVQTFPRISDFDTDQIEDTIWSCNPDWVDGFLALNMRWKHHPGADQPDRIDGPSPRFRSTRPAGRPYLNATEIQNGLEWISESRSQINETLKEVRPSSHPQTTYDPHSTIQGRDAPD